MNEMSPTARREWANAELVRALSLYCQLPFGQMHSRNPAIIAFARLIGRTPSAVALKLVNFASLDPALRARGIRGMSNASRLDRSVWDRFHARWQYLASAAPAVRAAKMQWLAPPPHQTTAKKSIAIRVGQGFFRNAVLSAYSGQCCITGISDPGLLRASHIIPWSVSEQHRLDPTNGICLNALHDAAFDRGLLSIDEEMRITVSSTARDAMPQRIFTDYFGRYDGQTVRAPERFRPNPQSLRYHREHVFIHGHKHP